MTRLVNGILIGAVTFVAALALISVTAPRLQSDSANAPEGLDAAVTDVRWLPGNGTTGLEVDLLVSADAGAAPASVTRVSFEVSVDGRILHEGAQTVGRPVPADGDLPVNLTVALPDDFASRWWSAYLDDGETSKLRISGLVNVQQGATRYVPLQWHSTWTGALLPSLQASAANCGNGSGLCLDAVSLEAGANAVQADLTLDNPGGPSVTVRNGTVNVLLGGHVVASGKVAGTAAVPANRTTSLAVTLAPQAQALDTWWAAHAARCEASPLELHVDLVVARPVAEGEVEVIHVLWQFPAAAFHSGFLCNHD